MSYSHDGFWREWSCTPTPVYLAMRAPLAVSAECHGVPSSIFPGRDVANVLSPRIYPAGTPLPYLGDTKRYLCILWYIGDMCNHRVQILSRAASRRNPDPRTVDEKNSRLTLTSSSSTSTSPSNGGGHNNEPGQIQSGALGISCAGSMGGIEGDPSVGHGDCKPHPQRVHPLYVISSMNTYTLEI